MPRLDDHPWSGPCAKGAKHRSHLRASARGLEAKVGEMITSSVSGPSPLVARSARGTDPAHRPVSAGVGGRGSSGHITSWHHHLLQRSLVLFSVGVVLALVLNLLQVQRNVTLFPEEVIATIFSSAWWVPPCCGTAAAVVGLLYPCIDSRLGEPHKFKREWASVMRCVAVFVGINHASAVSFSGCAVQSSFLRYTVKKLDFANNVQLSLTLAALSLGLWWTFDRSRSGLGLGITIAFLATVITQLLVYNGVYQYTSPDFLYIRSWLPCIFFSGGVTVGNIGRQLAMGVPEKPHSD
ncbi:insulin-induced gene 1 protein isoform X1 [Phocoena phocoena]|uniref:insulin-induced gene 1 protein isoform X1 n=1 Tax=Phocoena phocoena TaxID=9742 RepID=UPI003307B3EE